MSAPAKACAKCGEVKPLEAFSRHKYTRDGRAPNCYRCHMDVMRDANARSRARGLSASVVEYFHRHEVWQRDAGRCHICGRKADPHNWHLDHIMPLALGGEHSYRNVAVAHPTCNLSKGVRGPAQLRLGTDE